MIFVMTASHEDNSKCARLYSMYKGFMYRIALSILHNKTEAEDAVHDSFERVIRYKMLNTIEEDDYVYTRNLLGRVCRNASKDRVRKRGKEDPFSNDDFLFEKFDPDNVNPEILTLSKESVTIIKGYIKLLPEIYQDVFIMKTAYDMHTEQIAGIMGEKEETVRKRFARAKERLYSMLPKEEHHEVK